MTLRRQKHGMYRNTYTVCGHEQTFGADCAGCLADAGLAGAAALGLDLTRITCLRCASVNVLRCATGSGGLTESPLLELRPLTPAWIGRHCM